MESHKRTLLKTVTWRIIAVIITFTISWVLTRRIDLAAGIGTSDAIIKLFVYYAHERVWCKVPFGLPKPTEKDYQI